MTRLVEVFAELFRSFGHTGTLDATLPGSSGTSHVVPLLLERDARRTAVFDVVRKEALTPADLDGFASITKDVGAETGLVLSVAPGPDQLQAHAVRNGLTLWNAQRITQELGDAILAETCRDVWVRADPLATPRPSHVLAKVQEAVAQEAQTAAAPTPAPATHHAPTQLELPMAFGVLEQASPAPAAAPPPAAKAADARAVLRSQVSRTLALSLVRSKIRHVEKTFLRLTPYYVFDYEAHLLVDGSLDGKARKGRMAVEASQKRVQTWTGATESGPLDPEGADVDDKKVRISEADAAALLRAELVRTVTREVVMEEDDDEWSVVVRKKVSLAPEDVALTPLGLLWQPVWRVSGKEGSVEIDASTGETLHVEMMESPSDAQLI